MSFIFEQKILVYTFSTWLCSIQLEVDCLNLLQVTLQQARWIKYTLCSDTCALCALVADSLCRSACHRFHNTTSAAPFCGKGRTLVADWSLQLPLLNKGRCQYSLLNWFKICILLFFLRKVCIRPLTETVIAISSNCKVSLFLLKHGASTLSNGKCLELVLTLSLLASQNYLQKE